MPLGESMITTLRSNKRHKVNNTILKNGFTTIKDRKAGSFDHKTASPELLKEIQEKLQKDQKKSNTKKIILIGSIVIIVSLGMWFLVHNNYI